MNNEMAKDTKFVPITISSYTLGAKVSFCDRVRCAVEAGFDGIGLSAENYLDAINAGLTDDEMLKILNEYDIKVTEVECISKWGTKEDRNKEQQDKEQIIFHMAKLFNVEHVNCIMMEKLPKDQIITAFGELCERAGNLMVGLEFLSYSGVPDLSTALDVINSCGSENAMIIIDTWQWARANQTRDMIKNIPAEKVVSIQLSDVHETAFPDESLRDEALHERLTPGIGYGDVAEFVQLLKEHGISPKVISVEVMSDNLVSMGGPTASEILYNATKKVLDKAWPEISPKK